MASHDDAALAALLVEFDSRWPESQIEPSLTRITSVLDLLGNPQRAYPVILIAGTNGKTSTARMVESLLRAYGLRTGRFTSPHLVDVRERICIDGEPISAERLVETWADIAVFVRMVDERSQADGGPRLSTFEVLTALAYAAFADAPVDVAVMEVGLGGSWDATNVVDPAVAVITPIGIDHADYLGDTIELIAAEKAGIIKRGDASGPDAQPPIVVVGPQDPAALAVIEERCTEQGVRMLLAGRDFDVVERTVAVGGQVLTLGGVGATFAEVFLPLFGAHQAMNAATALTAVEAFIGGGQGQLSGDLVGEGFAQVTSPGRLEIVRRSPTVVVDAAHNPHGAKALADALEDSFEFASLVGVVGVLGDKDASGLLTALEPVLDAIVITEPASPRALPMATLTELAADIFGEERVWAETDLADAIDRATTLAEEKVTYGGAGVLVTGSVVLVGDAKRLLDPKPKQPKPKQPKPKQDER